MGIVSGISSIGVGILIPIIAIFFRDYCLTKYCIRYPNLNEQNKEILKNKIKEKGNSLYKLNILFSICATVVFSSDMNLFVLIPIFMVGFSIIFRVLKKIKISNILCQIVVISFLVAIVIFIFYIMFFYDNSYSCNESTMRDFEKEAFNSKFIQYEGEKRGFQIKTLVQECLSNNINEENSDRLISVYWDKDNSIVLDEDINNLPENNTIPSIDMSGYILGDKPEFNKLEKTKNRENTEIDSTYTKPVTNFIKSNNIYNVKMHYSNEGSNKDLIDCILITNE